MVKKKISTTNKKESIYTKEEEPTPGPLLFVSGGADLVVPMPEEEIGSGTGTPMTMTGLKFLQEGGRLLLKAGQGLLDVFADQDESWPASF